MEAAPGARILPKAIAVSVDTANIKLAVTMEQFSRDRFARALSSTMDLDAPETIEKVDGSMSNFASSLDRDQALLELVTQQTLRRIHNRNILGRKNGVNESTR